MTGWEGRRAWFVLGKGGVGRTTVALALAREIAASGRQVGLLELDGRDTAARRAGLASGAYRPTPLAPGLWHATLTAPEAVRDFGERHLGRAGGRALGADRVAGWLTALPGFSDTVQLGKIENLIHQPARGDPPVDVVVVDAPATGHGRSWQAGPAALAEASGGGPVGALAGRVARWLTDRSAVGRVVVTLGERVVGEETAALLDGLVADGTPADLVVWNRYQAGLGVGGRPPSDLWRALEAAGWCANPEGALVLDRLRALQAQHDEAEGVIATLTRRGGGVRWARMAQGAPGTLPAWEWR